MAYRMTDNTYYLSLAEKIMKKYKVGNDTLKTIYENEDEFPKKEVFTDAIADLNLQYNMMVREIVQILDMLSNSELADNRANKFIEELAEMITKDINETVVIRKFMAPAGNCILVRIKNVVYLICDNAEKLKLEYSSPEKAEGSFMMIYSKLSRFS